MAVMLNKPSIEKHAFQRFQRDWNSGKFKGLRLGQAFYNHFNLHKICDQESLKNLLAKDGEHAMNLIKEIFKFN